MLLKMKSVTFRRMEDFQLGTNLNSFVLADPKKCIGCRVCEVACAIAHTDKEIKTVGNMDFSIKPRLYLVKTPEVTMPVQCRHCEDAPCLKSCPVSAIKEQTNKIVIDEAGCIGCKSCMIACPFGAIELIVSQQEDIKDNQDGLRNEQEVIASKCDLCGGRLPACVEACPRNALQYVDMEKERTHRRIVAANKMGGFNKEFMIKEG
jgi:electron transport protein HydN